MDWDVSVPASAPGKGSEQGGGGPALLQAAVFVGSTQQGKLRGGGMWHFAPRAARLQRFGECEGQLRSQQRGKS